MVSGGGKDVVEPQHLHILSAFRRWSSCTEAAEVPGRARSARGVEPVRGAVVAVWTQRAFVRRAQTSAIVPCPPRARKMRRARRTLGTVVAWLAEHKVLAVRGKVPFRRRQARVLACVGLVRARFAGNGVRYALQALVPSETWVGLRVRIDGGNVVRAVVAGVAKS